MRFEKAGMTRKRPPESDAMPFLTGSDWSMSLNSPTSLGQAQILSALGQQLRERYEPVVKEPLPDRLGALVAQLERVAEESETR
jgi:Anti-sigma factor NepR